MKGSSGAKKRFSFTGSGKIKRKHAFKSHKLEKKGKRQKRNLGYSTVIDHRGDRQQVKKLLAK